MSVYSPVGGWTRWTLLFLSKSNTPWKLCFLCYFNFTCARMNPFPYLWFNLRLSLYPCHFHLKKKKANCPQPKQDPKMSPYQISNRFVATLLKSPLSSPMRAKGKRQAVVKSRAQQQVTFSYSLTERRKK